MDTVLMESEETWAWVLIERRIKNKRKVLMFTKSDTKLVLQPEKIIMKMSFEKKLPDSDKLMTMQDAVIK
jgi:hypothetical protein